jgi:4-amino-4-deoxy-L-arabinose transferase-like glycosyltransferase
MANNAIDGLMRSIERRPVDAFLAFCAIHFAVWVLLPSLLYTNLPLDLIEALVYGREWQFGYDKLPPLPWWLTEIGYQLVGHDFIFYTLAQIAVVTAFAFVFAMARPLIGGLAALVAILIIDGLHYLNYTAAKFNHDVIQLPFWALAGFALHRALRRDRMVYWVLLGVALGGAFWAKYFVAMLVVPLIAFAVVDRDARRALARPGPYVAAGVALLIAAPHLYWLVTHDFLPFHYAEQRAALSRGFVDHLFHPLQFIAGQAAFMVPALLIASAVILPKGSAQERPLRVADAYDLRIVTWLAFGPAATVILLSAVTGRGTIALWGYPLWLFTGVWLVMMTHNLLTGARLARIVVAWMLVSAGFATGFVVNYRILPRYDVRHRAVQYPGDDLALEISSRWRAATGTPLVYVISDMWTGGNISHYDAAERPRVLIDGAPERAPWIDLADLRKRGAVVVWTELNSTRIPTQFRAIAGDAEGQEPFTLPLDLSNDVLHVGWAILKPQP